MDWKFYIPHQWDKPTTHWEDIWLWPVEKTINGNMGQKINLTVDALGHLLKNNDKDVVDLANSLSLEDKAYWIWPYPNIEWGDDVSMIVNCSAFSKPELLHYARIYLENKGYTVHDLVESSEEDAFAEIRNDQAENYL